MTLQFTSLVKLLGTLIARKSFLTSIGFCLYLHLENLQFLSLDLYCVSLANLVWTLIQKDFSPVLVFH